MFDLFSPAFHENPFPTYRAMQDEAPVHRLALGEAKVAMVTRHADVARLICDERLTMDITLWDHFAMLSDDDPRARLQRETETAMTTKEGAEHTRQRRIVNRGFTPRAIAALEPALRKLVSTHIDRLAEEPRFDLHRDFAARIPVIAIARLVGVPEEDEERFRDWAAKAIRAADPTEPDEVMVAAAAAMDEIYAYVTVLIEDRRRQPREDLLSHLVLAEREGDGLSVDEVCSLCLTLLIAGADTTTNLIGLGTKALMDHPEQLALLEREPARIGDAVEEMLRYDHPGKFLTRVAREDLEIDGEPLPAGSLTMCGIGAAQRDPRVFQAPDRFDITRDNQESLAFGRGRHSCLGARFARLEGRLALEALVPWLSRLRYDPADIEWRQSLVVRGVAALPVERL